MDAAVRGLRGGRSHALRRLRAAHLASGHRRVSGTQALVLRRALLAAAALAATVCAHAAATGGDLHLLRGAPIAWGWIIAAAALIGSRRRAFRVRRPATILGLLVAAQAVLHATMTLAPWAFGLEVHHPEMPLAPGALLAHSLAALLLTALLVRAERILGGLVAIVAAVRRLFAHRLRRPRPADAPPVAGRWPCADPARLATGCRGPPVSSVV